MDNYIRRIKLPNGKWAYEQFPDNIESAQKHITKLEKLWTPPKYFYHFQPGGHVAAVQAHLANNYFAKVDLKDFFRQVTRSRILRRLKQLGYPFDEADSFAAVSTIREDKEKAVFTLPFGFVQSPMLASIDLDLSALGRALPALTQEYALSVYVDDIIISADCPEAVSRAVETIKAAAVKSNLPINKEKSAGPDMVMRAFNIDFSKDKMAVTADRFAEMKSDIEAAGPGRKSEGITAYVATVNAAQAQELVEEWPWLAHGDAA